MPRRAILATLPLYLLAAGCPSDENPPPPGKGVGEACVAARECRAGLVCSVGFCAAPSVPNTSCPAPVIQREPTIFDPGESTYTPCVTSVRTPVLGPTAVNADLRVTTPVSFRVDPGTTSITIFSQEIGNTAVDTIHLDGSPLPNTVVPTDVQRPNGSLLFSDTAPLPVDSRGYPDAAGTLAFYAGFTPTMGTFTIPNTSAALDLVRSAGELPSGDWTFEVNDWALECLSIPGCQFGDSQGTYRIQIFTGSKDPRSQGTLDLEVYLATDPVMSQLKSASDAVPPGPLAPQVSRWVQGIAAYFARAGVCIGTVTFHDLPDWARRRFALSGIVDVTNDSPCGPLSQLFTLALAQKTAVHLFLADELFAGSMPGGGTVLGVDGAIPGPSGVPGTITSGAVVGLFDLLGFERMAGACSGASSLATCGTDLIAYVAAHEAGHWLGLYHTTELTGAHFDPLSDTATCRCLSCAPLASRISCWELGATPDFEIMEARFCAGASECGGTRNLMFWLLDDALSAGELTPEQGEVIRLNPAVH